MPASRETTTGTTQGIGQHNCAAGKNFSPALCLGHQLLQSVHTAIKARMVLNYSADRCTIAENFSYGLFRESQWIKFGKILPPVQANSLQEIIRF